MTRSRNIAIGLGVPVLVILVVACFCFWQWRAARQTKQVIDALSAQKNVSVMYSEGTVSNDEQSTLFYCFHRVSGLSLSYEVVTESDVEMIASAIDLVELDLDSGGITESAIDRLGGLQSLEVLGLNRVSVVLDTPPNDGPLKGMGRPVPDKFGTLDQERATRRIVDDDLGFLRKTTAIKELDLTDSDLTDQATRYLENLEGLEKLHLSRTLIGDEGVVLICRDHPLLKELWLHSVGAFLGGRDDRLSDESVKAIAQLGELEVLDISGSVITENGLQRLAQMKSLKKLFLDECPKLTYGHVRQLRQQRPDMVVSPSVDYGPELDDKSLADRSWGSGLGARNSGAGDK